MSGHKIIALVTGASAGIGAEYCRQLAERCDLIIAVGRRDERLGELAAELADLVEVNCIAADLATIEGTTRVVECIRQTGSLDYLINNAGFCYFEEFTGGEFDVHLDMVRVHIDATLALCRAALPFMREKREGVVINLSSLAAFGKMQRSAVYGASKAFLNSFSLSLQTEEAAHGITVQCLCPGPVSTEFSERDTMARFDYSSVPEEAKMDAATLVSASLDALERDEVIVIPGAQNRNWVRKIEEKKLALLRQ